MFRLETIIMVARGRTGEVLTVLKRSLSVDTRVDTRYCLVGEPRVVETELKALFFDRRVCLPMMVRKLQ